MEVILEMLIFTTYLLNMKKLLKKLPIDHLNDNIVEKLKVSLIEQFLDNIIYESNHLNVDFNDLPFDGDEGVITR